MRWISIEPDAWGVVAIGQSARGVVAIGQWAWGVVAIGQFAFGGVAVGLFAVGGLSVGLGSLGLFGAGGLIGAGSAGRGPFVASLLPLLPPPRRVPETSTSTRQDGPGWLLLQMEPADEGLVRFVEGTTELRRVRLDARLRRAAVRAAPAPVYAHVRPVEEGWVVDQLRAAPTPIETGAWRIMAGRLLGLLGVAAIVWMAAVEPWLAALPFD
ncbi:MAG: hypothetical protein AAF211_21450 [Myxococcota bacterium]